ncbi:MAG: amidohydrolase family protein [Planctomycetota bacterium]|jgi:predicted TIM-barrel fold metal-dependent hydrolase
MAEDRIEIIDTHCHVEPWFMTPEATAPPPGCFDELFSQCRHRTRLVVSSTGRNPVLEGQGNVAAVRKLAELIGPFPDKLIGSIMVDPHDRDGALEAIEIGVRQLHMRCVGELVQYIHGWRTDGREILPVVARAIELDVPMNFHISSEDHAEGLARLAEKFRRGRFIAAHEAGGRAWRRGLEAVRALSNVWVEVMRPVDRGKVAAVIEAVGARRVLYGTDFGVHAGADLRYTAGNDLLDCLDALGLGAGDVERICSGNARELLGLDA